MLSCSPSKGFVPFGSSHDLLCPIDYIKSTVMSILFHLEIFKNSFILSQIHIAACDCLFLLAALLSLLLVSEGASFLTCSVLYMFTVSNAH